MIGRASIGYPWIFNEIKHYLKTGEQSLPPDMSERIRAVKKHLDFSIRWKGDRTGILEMRRHYTNYFKGIPDFKPYRMKLVELLEQDEIYKVLDEITEVYSNESVQVPV
jgi:tRNA-dihydrouridine synthase